ncbi:MAG: ribonucleoside-diphosphate reductase beta chain, partial [Solirubrobacteraceae bacterium]|nr:ribonucleoside-diphosphate reductase beta chain [Solirubrobacteraceae bacterium]
KLRAAGLPLESLPGPKVMPVDMSIPDRAARGIAMLEAGFIGPREGPSPRDPEAMAMLFDSIRRAVDLRSAPDPFVVQWDFSDAEPWHVRIADGAAAAAPGRAPAADLELRCRYEDFVDVVAGRLDPRRALATGRLRPRGAPRALWSARGLFAA